MAEFNITTSSNTIDAVLMSSIDNNNISPIMMTNPSTTITPIIISNPSNNLKKDNEENDGKTITAINSLKTTNIVHKLLQNKLKRKKKITSSLISVNGNDDRHTINEKKRTKIEKNLSTQKQPDGNNKENYDKLKINNIQSIDSDCSNVVVTKPPLPPKTNEKLYINNNGKIPPPRQKRKMEENTTIIQKLNAQNEQLRLEIGELKNSLSTERNAVRTLRAQYESENRKSKNEIKKLQTALEGMKKLATTNQQQKFKNNIKDDTNPIVKDHSNIELNKLNHEITILKDVNRILEEKIRICNDSERRKSLYVQELTDSYETRLTQISKSAKIEINRLLEEIKTKERNIGQLKKEINSNKNNLTNNQIKNKDLNSVQHPTEMKKLKDIETKLTNNCVNNDTNNNNNNKEKLNDIKNITTCNENELNSVQHEINERILEAHQNLLICRPNDNMLNSDTDSALSSAPQSISPQPPISGEQDQTDIWLTVRNCTKDLESLKNENHLIQKENDLLKNDLKLAKQQIKEFEKTAFEANNNNNLKLQQLKDRIIYLEEKERDLMKESHELHEQNELMEFRILELEESHDKWSIRSNSTPSDTKEMWTDTEKEHDDILIFTDRSDSGVTSPHSQNNIDDRNIISPCDLSLLDPMSNDELKRRITLITKKPNIDEDDKICLIQIIHLINNLDALSNDSIINCNSDDSISLELIKSKFSDYIQSSSITTPTSRLILQTSDKLINNNNNNNNKNSRIVATVLPYSSSLSTTPTDSPSRKYRSWTSSSLQESGIFDTDNIISSTILDSYYSQSTQTEPEDFPCHIINNNNNNNNNHNPSTTKDLCAEIQKLNKFREQIEECVNTKSPIKTTSTSSTTQQQQLNKNYQNNNNNNNNNKIIPLVQLSPNLSDQKRLQYYKERLDILENKLIIYESSGDVQIKLLSDRLQNEIKLKNFVKDLNEKVDKLNIINQQLEEEKCEFEEAENDTRLRLQRLEIDLEIINQRNIELEMSRDLLQNKLKETKNQYYNLQNNYNINDKKICNLIDNNNELTNRLKLIKMSMPAILLFNTFMLCSNNSDIIQTQGSSSSNKNNNNNNDNNQQEQQQIDENYGDGCENNEQKDNINKNNEYIKMNNCKCNNNNNQLPCSNRINNEQQQENEFINNMPMPPFNNMEQKQPTTILEQQLYNLQSRERELNMNIAELNRAYQETMENADCLWAQIEKDYKDKLSIAECNEQLMRTKINQLEDRLRNDCQIAQERINQLEEIEIEYKHRYCKIQKEYRDLYNENNILNDEYQNIKDEFIKLKKYCDGPGRQSLDLEKGRCKQLQDELNLTQQLLNEAEDNYKNDLNKCTIQGNKIRNDLLQIQVTNSELQEEVLTLEKQIAEFNINKRQYDDKLRTLLDEIRYKDDIIINLECRLNCLDNNRDDICKCNVQSLEEELNYGKRSNGGNNNNNKNNNNSNNNNGCKRFKIDDIRDLRTASAALGQVLDCVMECEKCKPDTKEIQEMALEVKGLADKILGPNSSRDENENKPHMILCNPCKCNNHCLTTNCQLKQVHSNLYNKSKNNDNKKFIKNNNQLKKMSNRSLNKYNSKINNDLIGENCNCKPCSLDCKESCRQNKLLKPKKQPSIIKILSKQNDKLTTTTTTKITSKRNDKLIGMTKINNNNDEQLKYKCSSPCPSKYKLSCNNNINNINNNIVENFLIDNIVQNPKIPLGFQEHLDFLNKKTISLENIIKNMSRDYKINEPTNSSDDDDKVNIERNEIRIKIPPEIPSAYELYNNNSSSNHTNSSGNNNNNENNTSNENNNNNENKNSNENNDDNGEKDNENNDTIWVALAPNDKKIIQEDIEIVSDESSNTNIVQNQTDDNTYEIILTNLQKAEGKTCLSTALDEKSVNKNEQNNSTTNNAFELNVGEEINITISKNNTNIINNCQKQSTIILPQQSLTQPTTNQGIQMGLNTSCNMHIPVCLQIPTCCNIISPCPCMYPQINNIQNQSQITQGYPFPHGLFGNLPFIQNPFFQNLQPQFQASGQMSTCGVPQRVSGEQEEISQNLNDNSRSQYTYQIPPPQSPFQVYQDTQTQISMGAQQHGEQPSYASTQPHPLTTGISQEFVTQFGNGLVEQTLYNQPSIPNDTSILNDTSPQFHTFPSAQIQQISSGPHSPFTMYEQNATNLPSSNIHDLVIHEQSSPRSIILKGVSGNQELVIEIQDSSDLPIPLASSTRNTPERSSEENDKTLQTHHIETLVDDGFIFTPPLANSTQITNVPTSIDRSEPEFYDSEAESHRIYIAGSAQLDNLEAEPVKDSVETNTRIKNVSSDIYPTNNNTLNQGNSVITALYNSDPKHSPQTLEKKLDLITRNSSNTSVHSYEVPESVGPELTTSKKSSEESDYHAKLRISIETKQGSTDAIDSAEHNFTSAQKLSQASQAIKRSDIPKSGSSNIKEQDNNAIGIESIGQNSARSKILSEECRKDEMPEIKETKSTDKRDDKNNKDEDVLKIFVQSLFCNLKEMHNIINRDKSNTLKRFSSRTPALPPGFQSVPLSFQTLPPPTPPSPQLSPCHCNKRIEKIDNSYPVTIENVRPLGQCSLIVKWSVHDFKNIIGYEIRVDGTVTNRYYSPGHTSSLIYGVDLDKRHIIVLTATSNIENKKNNIGFLERLYSPLIKNNNILSSRNWIPSSYIYDPY